jgi:hypothetical protein
MNRALYFLIFISFLMQIKTYAQKDEDKVLLTGVVLTGDPLHGVPSTNIIISNKNKGTASDDNGYFSFYAEKNDTIVFSAVGLKKGEYIVPEEFNEDHYSIVQILTNDTIWLQETIIFPWRSYEDFGEQLLTMKPPISDEKRAQMNLDNAQLYERYTSIYMDGSSNFKYFNQLNVNEISYAGQAPPFQIINPFAWAEFINSIKNGAYKK